MERPKPSTVAWGVLATGVVAYDVLCPPGETLSEGVDRALERSPLSKASTIALGAITLAHLLNQIPQPDKFDPFHRATKLKRLRERFENE